MPKTVLKCRQKNNILYLIAFCGMRVGDRSEFDSNRIIVISNLLNGGIITHLN